MNDKAKYWTAVLYPESMKNDWKNEIGDILQYPYVYCIHDKDVDKEGELRKEHVHVIVAFNNTTTYKNALSLFQDLGVCQTCQRVVNIRNAYEYLIHNTESSKRQNKYLYDCQERITGNDFDIGSYEQIGIVEKQKIIDDICLIIEKNNFMDFYELNQFIVSNMDLEYKQIFRSNQGYFNNLVKGKYLHFQREMDGFIFTKSKNMDEKQHEKQHEQHEKQHEKQHEQHENFCLKCGSLNVKKNGKTQSQSQKWRCNDCGKTFVK